MEEEIVRSWATKWRGLKSNLRKTQGKDPIDKVTVLVPEYAAFGIDPAQIQPNENYLEAYKRIKAVA